MLLLLPMAPGMLQDPTAHRLSALAILSRALYTSRLSLWLKPPVILLGFASPVTTRSTSLFHVDSPFTKLPKG